MIKREYLIDVGLPVCTFVIGVGLGLGLLYDTKKNLPTRQELIHEFYSLVVPFDINQTQQVFHEHRNGGTMQVLTNATNTKQIALIQTNLKVESDRFSTGNFTDESRLHGDNMLGLQVLSERAREIQFVYSNRSNGGQIQLIASDPLLIASIHAWFRAQLYDHGTDAEAHMEGMEDIE